MRRNWHGGRNNRLIYDPTNGQPFPGNVIPTARLSPQALALFKLLQPYAPTTAPSGAHGQYGHCGQLFGQRQGLFNADQWDARGDMQVTQKIHAFGRFSRFTDTLTGARRSSELPAARASVSRTMAAHRRAPTTALRVVRTWR